MAESTTIFITANNAGVVAVIEDTKRRLAALKTELAGMQMSMPGMQQMGGPPVSASGGGPIPFMRIAPESMGGAPRSSGLGAYGGIPASFINNLKRAAKEATAAAAQNPIEIPIRLTDADGAGGAKGGALSGGDAIERLIGRMIARYSGAGAIGRYQAVTKALARAAPFAVSAGLIYELGESQYQFRREYAGNVQGLAFSGQQQLPQNDPVRRSLAMTMTSKSFFNSFSGLDPENDSPLRNIIGTLTHDFEKAADAAKRLAEAHQGAVIAANQLRVRTAALTGDPTKVLAEQQAQELRDSKLSEANARRAYADVREGNLESGESFGRRKGAALKVLMESIKNRENLESVQTGEAKLAGETYDTRIQNLKMGGNIASIRQQAANANLQGNNRTSFLYGLAAEQLDAEATYKQELAGKTGQERSLIQLRQSRDRQRMRLETELKIRDFSEAGGSAMVVSPREAAGPFSSQREMFQQMLDKFDQVIDLMKDAASTN